MKKFSFCIILLSLISSAQAADTYYVPIQNLIPLGYNPLTTNYNPDYDNYTGLSGKQSQGNAQIGSAGSLETQLAEAKIKQLNSQYKEHVNSMVDATSLKDSVKNSALASQDRFQINQISGSGGCGSRGGPGYRKANGQCASWSD